MDGKVKQFNAYELLGTTVPYHPHDPHLLKSVWCNTITSNTSYLGKDSSMRVTTKGQVTIPQHIREKMDITPHTEVDFIEEDGRVILVKRAPAASVPQTSRRIRGIATVKMSTDEIMALTRGEE
jgi:AbrB family looped-hinge helix DNA binding protein